MADQAQPHYDWPLRFGPDGYTVVEQQTDAERKASAAVIASTPREWRDDDPTFGVTELVFKPGDVDVDLLAAEIAQADDRLALTVTETTALVNTIRREVVAGVSSAT